MRKPHRDKGRKAQKQKGFKGFLWAILGATMAFTFKLKLEKKD